MKLHIRNIVFIAIVGAAFWGCSEKWSGETKPINEVEARTFEDLVIPENFDWKTTEDASINLTLLNNRNEPIPNAIVKVYTDFPEEGGLLMIKGRSDESGNFTHARKIPSYYTKLVVATEHIGLSNFAKVPIENGEINYTFGGKINETKSSEVINPNTLKSAFSFLGSYDGNGRPYYLESPGDVVSNDFLQDLTNTLPEYVSVPLNNPYLLGTAMDHDYKLGCQSTVYVTFVHEGAGQTNVLGFYTYDIDNPPASPDDISNITVIFPNASYAGDGGGLQTGDKVKIGTFPANTGIGWVLIADGWQGGVTNGVHYYYSNKSFNHEANPAVKQHSLLLRDPGRDLTILTFEDVERPLADEDFNDCVFFVSTTPDQCVISDLPIIDYSASYSDVDFDGIPDIFDDYPNDPNYAFNNYYPCNSLYSTLAFEDLWPGKGDYDFNDLVIYYNFNQITNGANKIVRIDGLFKVMATGATYNNAFAFELPISPWQINSISGMQIDHNYLFFNANNTEAGQTRAVIVPFDNTYNVLPPPGLGILGANTVLGSPYVTPQTVNISIDLSTPVSYSDLGSPPYNPFIIVNQNRGYEVHLPDHPPTDLFNQYLFGTFEDDSNPGLGRYFKTDRNHPWAINIETEFQYPIEKRDVTSAYLHFAEWAESGGLLRRDWYLNYPGYRNPTHIFPIP